MNSEEVLRKMAELGVAGVMANSEENLINIASNPFCNGDEGGFGAFMAIAELARRKDAAHLFMMGEFIAALMEKHSEGDANEDLSDQG